MLKFLSEVDKKLKYDNEEDKIFISLKELNIESESKELRNRVSVSEFSDDCTSDSE